jgi:hypothetical protein
MLTPRSPSWRFTPTTSQFRDTSTGHSLRRVSAECTLAEGNALCLLARWSRSTAVVTHETLGVSLSPRAQISPDAKSLSFSTSTDDGSKAISESRTLGASFAHRRTRLIRLVSWHRSSHSGTLFTRHVTLCVFFALGEGVFGSFAKSARHEVCSCSKEEDVRRRATHRDEPAAKRRAAWLVTMRGSSGTSPISEGSRRSTLGLRHIGWLDTVCRYGTPSLRAAYIALLRAARGDRPSRTDVDARCAAMLVELANGPRVVLGTLRQLGGSGGGAAGAVGTCSEGALHLPGGRQVKQGPLHLRTPLRKRQSTDGPHVKYTRAMSNRILVAVQL